MRARGVARRFGAQVALEPTDIDVRGGESLALIGPNGAGKSTLLAILAGALEPSEGHVERVELEPWEKGGAPPVEVELEEVPPHPPAAERPVRVSGPGEGARGSGEVPPPDTASQRR